MYKINIIWSLTTLPNLIFCLSSNKGQKLNKQTRSQNLKHDIQHKIDGSNSTYPAQIHINRFFETQHGYELSSKHNISTHVDKIKDMFTLESPNDFFNIHEEQNAIFTKD